MEPRESLGESAARIRSSIVADEVTPDVFRSALARIPRTERDTWLDLVLGTDTLPQDGPALPQGCVPYLPCGIDVLLRMIAEADIQSGDVFVDVGAGLGRAAALTHLLTGAGAIGVEIQPHLVRAAHDLAARLNLSRLSVVQGDATQLTAFLTIGSVFFLNCPFSGERLEKVLDDLEPIARTRPIRVCCVYLPLASRPWLAPVSPATGDLVVYRSTLLDAG